MKFQDPNAIGPYDLQIRTVKKFLWLPTRLPTLEDKKETRWLRTCQVYQCYTTRKGFFAPNKQTWTSVVWRD